MRPASSSMAPALVLLAAVVAAVVPAEAQTEIVSLVEDFYGGYARKDAGAVMGLWSDRSPERTARQDAVRQLFAGTTPIEVSDAAVVRVSSAAGTTVVQVALRTNAFGAGVPPAAVPTRRVLELVRENGTWRVWRESDAYETLADAVAAAREPDRPALLAEAPDLQSPPLVQALIARADALRIKSEFPKALALFDLALRVAEDGADPSGKAAALRGRGIVHAVQGDLQTAERDLRASLAVAESASDKSAMAKVLANLGVVLNQQGDSVQGLEQLRRSAALLEEIGDSRALPGALGNIGLLYEEQGDAEGALEYAERALALSEAAGNKVWTARLHNIIANCHRSLGDYARALQSFERSLAMAEEIGDREQVAGVTGNIGLIYWRQGDPAQARRYYEKSVALFDAIGSRLESARGTSRLAELDLEQGDDERGLAEGRASAAIFEEAGDSTGWIGALNAQGEALRGLRQLEPAFERHAKALELAEARGLRDEAATALRGMAEIRLSEARPLEAVALATRAVQTARESNGRNELWQGSLVLARAARAAGSPAEAEQALNEAVATIEIMQAHVAGGELEEVHAFERRLAPYRLLLDMRFEAGDMTGVLDLVERTKARVLRRGLSGGRHPLATALSPAEREEERRLDARIAADNVAMERERLRPNPSAQRIATLAASLQLVRQQRDSYLVGLYAAHPELRVRRGEAPTATLADAVDVLAAGTALVEYAVTDAWVYALVVTRGAGGPSLDVRRLSIPPAELARRCAAFREQLGARDLAFGAEAHRLYEAVLAPIAGTLGRANRLVIVPDGPLWELPFQALEPRPGRALLEDDVISYAPSLTILREMARIGRRAPPDRARVLALGNPTPAGAAAMPEAEAQVRAVASLYGPARATAYLASDAREDRVKAEAGRFDVLHFAAHGVLDGRSPMYSRLVLAPGGKDDGFLEAREIMDLDLHADLAVLSACESGRGQVGAGEGLIGMAWAFFVAGCPASVVSEWPVDAASTGDLMIEFHRRLRAGDDKAEALRQASLKVARSPRFRHPFYWAGFVVMGDPR